MSYKAMAHIHSLNGEMAEITVLEEVGNNDYIVDYKGVKGELLHHCVGRMGYDQKFAREESLIFFIRTKEEPDKPLATVEYSLKNHSVLQCYADHDSKPNEDILNFVNNKWLPYANRKIKKLAA